MRFEPNLTSSTWRNTALNICLLNIAKKEKYVHDLTQFIIINRDYQKKQLKIVKKIIKQNILNCDQLIQVFVKMKKILIQLVLAIVAIMIFYFIMEKIAFSL